MAKCLKKTGISSLAIALLALGMGTGCSHHKPLSSNDQTDASNVPPLDAGTDAVPQASVEDLSGKNAPPTAATPPAPDASPTPDAAASPGPSTPTADANAAPATPPDSTQASSDQAQPAAPATSDSSGSYTVRSGDTLMKIAFENYGDLYKWKEIYQANKDHIPNPNALPPGTVLQLAKSDTPVTIERNGDQYLIKSGDTLGTISKSVYGTPSKWKKLWENNKQLIKDPNKIYAGFYLYYTTEQHLGLGSDQGQPSTSAQAPSAEQPRDPASVPAQARGPASISAQAGAQVKQAVLGAKIPGGVTPPSPAMLSATPPSANQSADLNQLVQAAQKDGNANTAGDAASH